MFRDRIFRISFLFSSAWHLFWILAVSIVIAPNVQPGDIYQEVDFLGPILEKTAFDIMTEKVTPHAETHYARTAMFAEGVFLKPKGPERRILAGFDQFHAHIGHGGHDRHIISVYMRARIQLKFVAFDEDLASQQIARFGVGMLGNEAVTG